MSHFVMEVSEDLQEEWHSTILHDNMNISCFMVHGRRLEEARDKRKSRYSKRARPFNGGSSKNRLQILDKPRFKKRVSNYVPSKFLNARDDKGNELKPKKGRSENSQNEKPTCSSVERVILVSAW